MTMIALALHGGAGALDHGALSDDEEATARADLGTALDAGWTVLRDGGTAVDAVVAAVRVMEESPAFNAGRGAVLTREGRVELDAALMDGRNRAAGAVTGVRTVRSPVLLARAIAERTSHVLLGGSGAEAVAKALGHELVEPDWFITDKRRRQLEHALAAGRATSSFGTVGCVALDADGNLAAATSTGGTTAKAPGRVGDSPIIGAGTWADDLVAVSCTGDGEAFLRAVAAYQLAARLRWGADLSLAGAARATLDDVRGVGGEGGLVAVDRRGNVALPFVTSGMYRAWRTSRHDVPHVAIYPDE